MILEVDAVDTFYGETQALFGVSLAVARGEVFALLGPNGAGKTTTLRSILGLTRPRRGAIRFDGRDVTRRPTHEIARAGIGWVPDDRRLCPTLTVARNLHIAQKRTRFRAWSIKETCEIFSPLEYLMERDCENLSGGEMQMVAIARALVGSPGLDPVRRAEPGPGAEDRRRRAGDDPAAEGARASPRSSSSRMPRSRCRSPTMPPSSIAAGSPGPATPPTLRDDARAAPAPARSLSDGRAAARPRSASARSTRAGASCAGRPSRSKPISSSTGRRSSASSGPNGAGKTTLFEMMTGSNAPTAGRVYVAGTDIHRVKYRERDRLAIHYHQSYQVRRFRKLVPSALLRAVADGGARWCTCSTSRSSTLQDGYIGFMLDFFRKLRAEGRLVFVCLHPTASWHLEILAEIAEQFLLVADGGVTRYPDFPRAGAGAAVPQLSRTRDDAGRGERFRTLRPSCPRRHIVPSFPAGTPFAGTLAAHRVLDLRAAEPDVAKLPIAHAFQLVDLGAVVPLLDQAQDPAADRRAERAALPGFGGRATQEISQSSQLSLCLSRKPAGAVETNAPRSGLFDCLGAIRAC